MTKKKTPKRILVTGATSRQCNPMKNSRDAMVSWLIAEICRDLGYDVEHRDPAIYDDLKKFDHVFCAIAPLHALGANRVYGALATVIRATAEDKLTMYLDDVDSSKIVNGIKTMVNDPYRFTKPFFVYRKEYEIAVQDEWHDWLMTGVENLAKYAWPHTLVPAFPWADKEQLLRNTPNITESTLFDPTSYLPDYGIADDPAFDSYWVTESMNDKWLARQRVQWPILRYGKGFSKRPQDEALCHEYSRAEGVLDEGIPHGWWHSRLPFATRSRAVYVTNWQNVEALGDSFAYLADTIEDLDQGQMSEVREEQAKIFNKLSSPKDEVKETIRKVVER